MSECTWLRYNTSCSDTPGCSWDGVICHTENSTLPAICAGQFSIEDCSNAGTQTCLGIQTCQSTNDTSPILCDGTRNATSCAGRGSECQMKGACTEDPCGRFVDRGGCTERPGCFWGELTTTAQNFTEAMGICQSCFGDPIVNIYSTFQSLVGLSCTRAGLPRVMNFTQAFAATTLCDGGVSLSTTQFLSESDDGSDIVCVPCPHCRPHPLAEWRPHPHAHASVMPTASSAPTPMNETLSAGGRLTVSHAVLAGFASSWLFFLA